MTQLTEAAGEKLGIQGVIINDCYDPNARARQATRFEGLFGVSPSFVELGGENADLQAAGQLVDTLDAATTPGSFPQRKLIALVNVAPRGDDVRGRWPNGTPFCHFETADGHSVFSTFEGRSLSLARDLGLVGSVEVLDIPTITDEWAESGLIGREEADGINSTQFRSKDFLPLAAWYEQTGGRLPSETHSLDGHPSVGQTIWWIDNFGNGKTTLLPEEVEFEEGKVVMINGQELVCHERLADVPTGQLALTIGSSGYGERRFLEIVEGKGRAADRPELGLSIGSIALDIPVSETSATRQAA